MISKPFGFLLVMASIWVIPDTALSGIYRWVDENGKIYYSDKPSQFHASEPVKLHINTYEGVTYDTSSLDVGKKVVMYSTAWCGVCKKARRYFKRKKIRYAEYDVEKTLKGRTDYKRMDAKGVPILLVGNRRMNGFTVKGFERLYKH